MECDVLLLIYARVCVAGHTSQAVTSGTDAEGAAEAAGSLHQHPVPEAEPLTRCMRRIISDAGGGGVSSNKRTLSPHLLVLA